MTLKHNKKKNSMIVFEQLTSVLTRLASSKKNEEAKFVLNLIKEFYNSSTEMGKEKKLFEALLSQSQDEKTASLILRETLNQLKLIDEKKLDKEKQRLIRKITSELDGNLYKIPIKEFKKYASIQILFNEEKNGYKHTTPSERVKIKNEILENLSLKIEQKEDEPKIDNFTFKILINKFNKKYNKLINEDQKHILKGWLNYLLNQDNKQFEALLQEKCKKIKFKLNKYRKLNEIDTETKTLLNESYEKLNKFDFSTISEERIYDVMNFFDICDDFEQIKGGEE